MKRKMDKNDLENFFQEGIVNDLMYASYHYLIWRTIGENFDELKKSENNNHFKLFGHIQSSSHDLAILSLAKTFDTRNNKYQVRSINEFLDFDFENTIYFPLESKDYEEFVVIRNRLGIYNYPSTFESPNSLASFFKTVFNSAVINNKVKKVKFIRNKTLAHNEHNVDYSDFENFWNDYLYLIDFIKIFVSLFGVTVIGSHYFQFEDFKEGSFHYSVIHQIYWLVDEIEKEIGKGAFNCWWTE